MAKDLKIDIDGARLNVRVGAIIRHGEDIIVEISKVGRNSVIPGGRIQINEKSSLALKRELKEELHFDIDASKAKLLKVFENFFTYDDKDFHEIYFLYEYILSEEEFEKLNLTINYDNSTTYFKYISKFELEKYNLLPLELYEFIEGGEENGNCY